MLGYSQGGRIALLTTLEHPDLVERLILVSASPGIEAEDERRARREMDEALARHIEATGVEQFIDEWLNNPVTGTGHLDEIEGAADRMIRRENSAAGLAAALRGLGQGSQPFVGDRIGELVVPLITVSGERDHKYTGIAAAMASAAPDGRHTSINGAGHNVILDAPEALMDLIAEFCVIRTP